MEPNIPYLILCDAEGENLLKLGTATLSKAEEGFIYCHSVTRNYVFQGKYATGIEDIHVISDEGESGKQGIFDLQGRQLNAEPTHGIYVQSVCAKINSLKW